MLKTLKKNFEIDERKTDKANIKHVYVRVVLPVILQKTRQKKN